MAVVKESSSSAPAGQSSGVVFGKHQLSSVLATTVDYCMMIILVSIAGLSPVLGTIFGAASGATANFTLGRHFTFRATHDHAHGQAFRYLLVSAASLGFNALGEHLFAVVLGLQYVVARLIIGTLVGCIWNYPMHRYFVFK